MSRIMIMRKLPIDPHKLKEIAERFGGWEKISAPEYEPGEDLLQELEAAGLNRKVFAGMRLEASWTPRQRAVRYLARDFLLAWSKFHREGRRRENASWHDDYHIFWNVWAINPMREFDIKLEEIAELIPRIALKTNVAEIWNPNYVIPPKPVKETIWTIPTRPLSYEEAFLRDATRRFSRAFHPDPKDGTLYTKIRFKILKYQRHQTASEITDITIVESSGNPDFDKSAQNALRATIRPSKQDFHIEVHFQMSGCHYKLIPSED